ncbi:MAG: glycosyltransferase [Acidobacteriaceae bacterium]|nr:glycosyltransferase [Acidobacteriaceae bacterium]
MKLRIALFYHSLVSDWNHGNAHFLRGVASELQSRGHEVNIFEPENSWSRQNLLEDRGPDALAAFERAFPNLTSTRYSPQHLELDGWLDGIDLVLVHEWNEPQLIAAIGKYRSHCHNLVAFFHDTHHRALTAEEELSRFDLSNYDGVLAYGASLKRAYERRGWGRQVHVWHEAADVRVFCPREFYGDRRDLVWIGNWGDEERTEELREYFLAPIENLKLSADVYGVRYPPEAIHELNRCGIRYGGWLPNFEVPEVFAQFRATVHVPRRPYTRDLPGIPTIRPFEALACGIPLVSAPWRDEENLFRVGTDFLMAENGEEMQRHISDVLNDTALAASLVAHGLETIRSRHTCADRVDELFRIYRTLEPCATKLLEAALSEEVTA